MINKVILVGNLGREPDIKFTGDGKAIANLAVATSESWTDKNTQQKVEKTEWHRGKLQTRKWDKEGVTQYTTEVVLSGFNSNLMMLDSKGEPYEPTPVNLDVAPEKKIQPVDDFEDDMEDIPF